MAAAEYIMALDVGDKRIGVALAHRVARLARPLTTLIQSDTIFTDILSLIDAEQVGAIVVGLPRGMDGGYTAQTKSAEAFGKRLESLTELPVYFGDETLTSVQAETEIGNRAHTKADVDALAAVYILESFLLEHNEVLAV